MKILNERLLLAAPIKIIINRRCLLRYDFSRCQALILGKSGFYAKKYFWVFHKSDRGNAKRRQGDVFQVKKNWLTSDYGTICVSTETFSYEFIGLTIML